MAARWRRREVYSMRPFTGPASVSDDGDVGAMSSQALVSVEPVKVKLAQVCQWAGSHMEQVF